MPFVLEPLTAESGFELTPEKPQEFELTPLDKPQAVAGYEQPPETWYGDLGRRFAEGTYKLEADIYSLAGRGLKTVGAEDTGQQFLDEAAKLEGTSLGTEPVSMEGLYGAWKAGDTLGVAKEVGRLGPKVVAGSLPMMIAAGVNGPAFYALLAEDMAREQAKNSGRVDPEWGDYATAAPFAVISGALERWGLKGLINAGRASGASLTTLRGIAQVAKEVGKATGKEIGTEMIQEPTEYVGETIGTQLPPTLAGAGERSLMGGIGGLFGGGAVSAVATPINMAAQRRNATEIPELELIREGDLMPQQPEVPPAENLLGWPASVSGFEAPPGADLSTPEDRQAAVDTTLSTEEFTDLSTRAKAAVTQELDRLGLKDFDVQTVDRLFTLSGDQTDAEYQNRIFRVALDTPLADLPSVMNHEVIHALKEMGAFTKEQWTILERSATQRSSMDPVRLQQYMRAYVKQGMTRAQAFEIINEEAVGDMHREFHDGRLKPMGTLKKALQRIDQFFEATGNGLRGLGFTSSAGIMEAIQAGKFGVSANQQLTGPARYSLRQHTPAKMYSALERMVEGVKQARMPGLQWLQFIQSNAPKFGVKEPEIQWTLTRQFLAERVKQPVTKEELLTHLRDNAIRTTVVGGRYNEALGLEANPEYSGFGLVEGGSYTMPGLNERGAILVGDRSRGLFEDIRSHYFSQKGTLGWVRYGVTTDVNGRAVLFIDEVQSDWGQARGRLVDMDSKAWNVRELPIGDALGLALQEATNNNPMLERLAQADPEAAKQAILDMIKEDLGIRSRDKVPKLFLVTDATERDISMSEFQPRVLGEKTITQGIFARDEAHAKERVLRARRAALRARTDTGKNKFPAGPYVSDTTLWVQRTLKELISLAIDEGYETIAIVNGQDQVNRYFSHVDENSRPEEIKARDGIKKFYDETLPSTIKALIKSHGGNLRLVEIPGLTALGATDFVSMQEFFREEDVRAHVDDVLEEALVGTRPRESNFAKALRMIQGLHIDNGYALTEAYNRLEELKVLARVSDTLSRAIARASPEAKISLSTNPNRVPPSTEAILKAREQYAKAYDMHNFLGDLLQSLQGNDRLAGVKLPRKRTLRETLIALQDRSHVAVDIVTDPLTLEDDLMALRRTIRLNDRGEEYIADELAMGDIDKEIDVWARRVAHEENMAMSKVAQTLQDLADSPTPRDAIIETATRPGFDITQKLAESVQKNGWTKFSIRRAANRQTTTNPQVAQQMYERLNRIYGTKLDAARLGKETARFNWFMKNILTLPQVERENWDVPGVRPFVDAARRWWGTKGQWVADWDQWIAKVRNSGYGKAEQSKLWRFANEVTVLSDELGRRLTTAELANEARKVGGLDAGLMELWTSGRAMLQEALNTLEELARARVTSTWNDRILQQQDIVLRLEMEKARDKALKALEDDFQKMRNRDYWPLARFGEYTVNVVAKVPLRYMGKEFKPGQTVLFELYETEGEQASRKAALLKAHPRKLDIAAGKVDESLYSFMGLPPSVLRMLESELSSVAQDYLVGDQAIDAETMKMLQEQLNALRTVMLHFTPENAFKQRLLRRKGTRGFTDDGLRAMASLGQSFAGHIARAQHRGEMDDALKTLDMHRREMEFATDPALAGQGNKLTDLLNFFRRSQRDMMNPGNDLANLRALGFLWYLGAVPRAAAVQVWQPFATTYPWMASRYGDATAVAEMGKAYRDFIKLFKGKGGGLPIHLEEAVALGMKMGFLNQSLFTELAGVAEGSNLQRLLPGKFLKSQEAASVIRRAGYYSSLLFQKGEELNRLVTFKAVYMAELRKVLGMEANTEEQIATKMQQLAGSQQGKDAMSQAFLAARTAVESTQGEYARWARPELMRGKKSAIFLFKMYSQLMNYFAIRDPGKWRFLAIQASVAGALGLPFAEDLLDILNAATQGAMCKTGDIRDCVREYVSELGANPELVMHGGSRYLGPWDLSANMSLGSVVPGVEPLTKAMMPGGDLRDQSLRLQTEALGALFAIPLNFAKALSTGQERDFEQAMPTIVRDIYRTIRRAREGGEVSRSGEMLVPVDWSDPGDVVTHLGEAIGFRSNELTAMRDMRWSQKEAAKYWGGRREAVVGQFYHLYKTEGTPDREALADVMKAVTDFNASVPYPEMAISGAQLKKGLRASIQRQKLGEAGIAPEKKYRRLYSEVAEGFAY